MISEIRKEREMKDEQKLMNAIHRNYEDMRMERLMNEQLKELAQNEHENAQKKMMRLILLTGLLTLILEALAYV